MKFVTAILTVILLAAFASADQVDVRQIINDAIAAKAAKVVIPPGDYKIAPADTKAQAHLVFSNVENLEIDGTGARLIFTDPEKPGFIINRGRNVTLKGFAIDYDPLPFTQGTITALEPESKSYLIKIDEGYLANPVYFTGRDQTFAGGRMAAYLLDASGQWKTDAFDMYPSKFEIVEPLTVRLGFASADFFKRQPAAVGDRVVISRRTAGAMRLNHVEHSNIDGVTVFACGGIAIQEASGNGHNRFKMTVTRGPTPPGATAPRLHSVNADGLHSSSVKKGPIVEDSLFEWMGDDAVAVHGTYALATAQPSESQVTLSPKFELPFEVGDDLTVIDGTTYQRKAMVKVTKVDPAAANDDPAVAAMWEKYKVDQRGRKFYTLTFDGQATVAVGDLITSPQRIGNGYVVRNNIARHHRARGIQMKAGDGVIENNTIEDVNMAGITLGPEFSIWLGSDYVKNVVVRNNTIRRTGRGGEGRLSVHFADIAGIAVRSLTLDRKLSPPENANIVIEGNRIESPAGLAMFLSSTRGLTVRNNTITAPYSLGPGTAGKNLGVDPSAAVFIAGLDGATFENNTVDLSGGQATKPVATGEGNANLAGVETGFTVKSPTAAAR
jgi:hypothetical protein